MRILVTGGCGFIGSHLVDALLADGHDVSVLDNMSTGKRENLNANASLITGDVADATLVNTIIEKVDAVYHLAAVASVDACTNDWLNSHRTNLTGTVTLLEAAAKKKIPVVYASSAAVYGDNSDLPLKEDAAKNPLSAYGLDKYACEQYAAIAQQFHGVPSVGLRFFNVYGPRQDPKSPYSGVISIFVAKAKAGEPLTFNGDGEQTRDFIYVADIVALLMAAMKHAKGAEVFNGCTGSAITLKQLAAEIGNAVGNPVVTSHAAPRSGDIRHSLGDPAKAKAALGFTARTSLADGLKALVAHA